MEMTPPQTGMYGLVGFADSPSPWSMIERSCAACSCFARGERRHVRRDAAAALFAVTLRARELHEVVRPAATCGSTVAEVCATTAFTVSVFVCFVSRPMKKPAAAAAHASPRLSSTTIAAKTSEFPPRSALAISLPRRSGKTLHPGHGLYTHAGRSLVCSA